jgi:hypothetical protein
MLIGCNRIRPSEVTDTSAIRENGTSTPFRAVPVCLRWPASIDTSMSLSGATA